MACLHTFIEDTLIETIISCNNNSKKQIKAIPLENLMESSPSNDWVSLIQENTMEGWHYYQDNGQKSGWGIENGVLTFPFTIRNQFTAALSTLEAAIEMREEILNYQKTFYIK